MSENAYLCRQFSETQTEIIINFIIHGTRKRALGHNHQT